MTDLTPPRTPAPLPPDAGPVSPHVEGSPFAGIGIAPSQENIPGDVLRPLRQQAGRFASPATTFGPLQELRGHWRGNGFNVIWRPNDPQAPNNLNTQDHFLALNLTSEVLNFRPVSSAVPNRGGDEPDIALAALHYRQEINDANFPPPLGGGALHFEPGLWLSVPATPDTANKATVNRLGSIPHGTTILAVGTATVVAGNLTIDPVDITPFQIGHPSNVIHFPEETLAAPTPTSRTDPLPVGIDQAIVNNPNNLLTSTIAQLQAAGLTLTTTTVLHVDTTNPVAGSQPGGGIDAIPFLNPGNAQVAETASTFWIETWIDKSQNPFFVLQYSQTVLLNFKGLSWPHITVGNLVRPF